VEKNWKQEGEEMDGGKKRERLEEEERGEVERGRESLPF